jgi:beta-galactosidase
VLYGPRTGSKTRHFGIPPELPPGPLGTLLDLRIMQVGSLRPGLSDRVNGSVEGSAVRWREHAETGADVMARFANGDPALIAKANHHYLACWPDEQLLASVMAHLAHAAKLDVTKLPAPVRMRRRGGLTFVMNYGDEPYAAPLPGEPLLGKAEVEPQSVSAWRLG